MTWFNLIDVGCSCTIASFLSFAFHLAIIGVLVFLMVKVATARRDKFFIILLMALIISGAGEFFDLWHNFLTKINGRYVYKENLDILTEILQAAGLIMITGIMLKFLRQKHE